NGRDRKNSCIRREPGRERRRRSLLARERGEGSLPGLHRMTAATGLAPVGRRLLHKLGGTLPFSAPTGLVPVERRLLHKKGLTERLAPTGLVPVERRLLGWRRDCLVFKPPLHRDEPGGGGDGASHALVHKPALHRGEPGGGDRRSKRPSGAETHAPPGRARWGAGATGLICDHDAEATVARRAASAFFFASRRSSAALTNPLNSGWACVGFDLNSG